MQIQEKYSINIFENMTISEQLTYLYITENRQNNSNSVENFSFGIFGGVLSELYLLKRIAQNRKRVVVIDNKTTGTNYLDTTLDFINSVGGEKTILELLSVFSPHLEELINEIENILVEKTVIGEKRHKIFWLFGRANTYSLRKDLTKKIFSNIKSLLETDQEPDRLTIHLASILNSLNYLPKVYNNKKELDFALKRLDLLLDDESFASSITHAIKNHIKLESLSNLKRPQQKSQYLR